MEQRSKENDREIVDWSCPKCGATHFYYDKVPDDPDCIICRLTSAMER